MTLDGAGNFDRVNATGWFALNSSAASLGRLTGLIVPFSPALAARLNAAGTSPGMARLKLTLDLNKDAGQSDRVQARATADLDLAAAQGRHHDHRQAGRRGNSGHRSRRALAQ